MARQNGSATGVAMARRALRLMSLVAPGIAGRVVLGLFHNPRRRAEVRVTEREVHRQAEVDRIDLGGASVVCYRWGDGARPVLFVHGWASRASRCAPYVAPLRERGYTLVTFDAPAHGDSAGTRNLITQDLEIIRQLHDRYGRFAAVIAYSKGVLSAFHALRSGVSADRLVTIAGPCCFDYLPQALSRRLALRPRVQADLRRRVEGLFTPETDIWERFSAHHQPDTLRLPMLLIHDDDDDVVDPAQAAQLAAAYPGAIRHTTRGLGHRRVVADDAVVRRAVEFVAAGSAGAAVPEESSVGDPTAAGSRG